ncbi:hypothetical protein [Paraburkholderia sp. HD33-4]|uniref:hypothetical protein n=1 Tax=Paraburkholderia sp. HD33-4 TaxID=2883242 RepID=UPI001F2E82DA|nr:hypothetical protein [Paraburkholderia sp. HD33-4]
MHQTLSVPDALASRARRLDEGDFSTQPFVHPGQVTSPRLVDVTSGQITEELRVAVPPGANVGRALHRVLDDLGPRAGCGRIVGGICQRIQYHVMIRAAAGVKPYVYGSPIVVDGQSMLISAAITVGHKDDGARILHCHGGFTDENGKAHGGHIILDETVAGGDGLVVRLCLFDGVDFVVTPDTETTFDLLKPVTKL